MSIVLAAYWFHALSLTFQSLVQDLRETHFTTASKATKAERELVAADRLFWLLPPDQKV